jgi:hypothetical protein
MRWAVLMVLLLMTAPCRAADLQQYNAAEAWETVPLPGGQAYAVNTQTIQRGINGDVAATVCGPVKDNSCTQDSMSAVHFDCRGHLMIYGQSKGFDAIEPNSIAARLAAAVCR